VRQRLRSPRPSRLCETPRQTQFSLLSYLDYQRGTKEVCDELGITLIAYSPLCLGLLSGKYRAERGVAAAAASYPPGPRGLLARQLLRGAEQAGLLPTLAEIAARRNVPETQVR
jgi:pyridoxine 4-dehydrogenase